MGDEVFAGLRRRIREDERGVLLDIGGPDDEPWAVTWRCSTFGHAMCLARLFGYYRPVVGVGRPRGVPPYFGELIAALRRGETLMSATRAVGVNYYSVYQWRKPEGSYGSRSDLWAIVEAAKAEAKANRAVRARS